MKPLTPKQANSIYSVLVANAGVRDSESERAMFVDLECRGCTEYRFQGLLGFGGKFWNDNHRWYVNCYPEDETPERLAMIAKVNEELAKLRSA